MEAEIIAIGDEILIGQTMDTNSSWLAKKLNAIGIDIRKITAIRDRRESILYQLAESESKAQLIILMGGLGPTVDDITKQTLCEYFNTKLIRNDKVLKKIEHFFISNGRDLIESNRKQADLPETCTILNNDEGTASGMWFEKNDKVFISLPGVPYEMKHIVENEVLWRLPKHFNLPFIVHHTTMTEGIGESFLAKLIEKWENSLANEDIKIAYLPKPYAVKIRLSTSGYDKKILEEKIQRKVKELHQLIPSFIFGEDNISPEENIAQLLKAKNYTVSTAESCTGGYLAHLLTSVPGSSSYFLGSVIAYSNKVKIKELNISEHDINTYGAVSKQVVQQMAINVRKKMNTDFGIATSGIAGPDGGSKEKPVGTVWIALATSKGVYAKRFQFEKHRTRNIQHSSYAAISILRQYLSSQLKIRF